MKKQDILKRTAVIMLIILISLISFLGVYVKKLNKMENIVPEYIYSMDFKNRRIVKMDVDTSTKTIYYDKEKNVVDSEVEGGTTEQIAVNDQNILTAENFIKSKEIIDNRLKKLGAEEYYLRQDENGYIVIELPDEEKSDIIAYAVGNNGVFEVKDKETHEKLLTTNDIKSCDVLYNTTENGTSVYLSIQMTKDATKKLEEISKSYVQTTDEEGNTVNKNIVVSIDETTLADTYFGQTISNGVLQIPIGNPSTLNSTVNLNYQEAKVYEVILECGELPVAYLLDDYSNTLENNYTLDLAKFVSFIGVVVLFLFMIYLIARYKVSGIFAGILQIGFIASLLLIIRYTNCVMSVNGMIAIVIISLFQFMFLNSVLNNKKKYLKTEENDFKQAFLKYIKLEIPIDVIAILYTFANWTPISSMGMILFWGAVLFVIYNAIFTKVLMVENKK